MENNNLNNCTTFFIASLCYCHFFVPTIPQGFLRIPFVLPLFYLLYTISWNFENAFLRGISSFFITWILSFKLLLFCFNQGPLSNLQNFFDFLIISIFPVKLKNTQKSTNGTFHFLKEKCETSTLNAPTHPCTGLHEGGKSRTFDFLQRYEVVELFNQPYKATSFAEFWGRRWNRFGSDMVRQTIYKPTRRMFSSSLMCSPKVAMVMAIINSFLVSAAMHELMFYYITCGAKPTFEVTKFFVLQGLLIALEAVFGVKGWDSFCPGVSLWLKRVIIAVSFVVWLILPTVRNGRNKCEVS